MVLMTVKINTRLMRQVNAARGSPVHPTISSVKTQQSALSHTGCVMVIMTVVTILMKMNFTALTDPVLQIASGDYD